MKTTIEISDTLLRETRRFAGENRLTLRQTVEQALRRYLDEQRRGAREPFRLRKAGFGGEGLQPGLREGDWELLRRRAYEDRGG